jgi:hypothetical protein
MQASSRGEAVPTCGLFSLSLWAVSSLVVKLSLGEQLSRGSKRRASYFAM